MANKEINLEALLSLDEQIQRELGAMESNISQLPQDGISRDLYGDYMARFNRIRSLFDRASDILRDAPLEQTNPDLYDILLAKQRINENYNVLNRMLGGFTRQYNKSPELDEGRGERTFAPSASQHVEEHHTLEDEPVEETPDDSSAEELEAALAEEEAAEAKAAEKKKKAAKKARQEKVAQEERDAIERDRTQREAELRDREDQRRMEDRRLEEDRLAQDRSRDAMLSSELHKAPYEAPTYPEQIYPEPHGYEPSLYERAARESEQLSQDRHYEQGRDYEDHSARSPEYDKPPVSDPPRYAEQERFYPSHHEHARYEPQHHVGEQYPESPRYEDRRYETPAYTTPTYPDYEDRRQAPQSAADKRDQEFRDADQRAREEQRREDMRRERDARFERYRDRQQGGFTREEQQFSHFDYSAREGETGRREHGHSDYKSYDSRDESTHTAHEYAPGGTIQRPMPIGSTPRNDAQRFYSTPAPGTKAVTPEYLEQHRYEMQSARLAYEQVKGTPEAKAAEVRYEQLRHSYEDTCKQIHSGSLKVAHPSPVNHVDFQSRPQDPPRPYDTPYFSTQYNYLPGGGIAGAGISGAAPSGSVSYYNSHRDTPPVQTFRYENNHPYQNGPTRGDVSDIHRTSPFSSEPRHYTNEPVRTQAPQHTPDTRSPYQPSGSDASRPTAPHFDSHREPPVQTSRYENNRPYQNGLPRRDASDIHRTSPFSSEPRHYPNEPVRTQAPQYTPDTRYQRQAGVGVQSEHQAYSYRPAPRVSPDNKQQDGFYSPRSNSEVERIKSAPSGQTIPNREHHLPHSYKPLQNAAPATRGFDNKPSHTEPVNPSRGEMAARNVLRNDPMPTPVPSGPRYFHINPVKSNPEVSQVHQIPGYYGSRQESSPLASRKPYIIRSFEGKPVADTPRTAPASSVPRSHSGEPVRTQAPQHTSDIRYQRQAVAGVQSQQPAYSYRPAPRVSPDNKQQDGLHSPRSNPGVERVKSTPSGQTIPNRDHHLPHSYKPLQNAASAARGFDNKPSQTSPVNPSRREMAARNVLRNDPMPTPVPSGPRYFHINPVKSNPEVSQVHQIPGYYGSRQGSSPLASRKPYIIRSFEGKPVAGSPRPAPTSNASRGHSGEPVRTPTQQRTSDTRSQHQPSGPRVQPEHQAYGYRPAPRANTDGVRQDGRRPSRNNPVVEAVKTPSSRRSAVVRDNHLPHSFRPLPNAATGAGGKPAHVDPVTQINKMMASRNVLRKDPMPAPVPPGPRYFHINVAKSNSEVSQISQIPGHFRKQQGGSLQGSRKSYIINSFAGQKSGPNGPGSRGTSGQDKDGSSSGNGPRKSKVEETSSDLLNRKSKLRTESIAKHYSRIIAGKAEGYASWALMAASRRFYQIAQSGEDNALRTLEQGRYYGTVAIGLADAYMHRKPVSSRHAIKTAGRREFREYGRFSTMGKKQLTREIHESLKANRQLKNEIRELTAKGSSLTMAERAELLKKRAQLAASSIEPRKMHGYRNMQATHARDIRANKLIEKTSEGGKITSKTVQKAMQADFKAREASMAKKFGSLNRFTDKSLRLEIQRKTQIGRVLKKEIKELKALQASGVLTHTQARKLQDLLKKREAINKELRQLHGLKNARLESNLFQKSLQKKMVRLEKNKAAIRGGLYALYGLIIRPIQDGSEIGAQGLVKFANVATNHYVHEFIKRSLRAMKKTYLWGAKITHFNKTKLYTNTAKTAKKVSSAVKGAPKKAVKATGRVIKRGALRTYDKVAPVKVKTAVTSAYNRYTGAKGAIVAAKAKAKEWVANTWVGRAYSSVSNFFGNIGRGISTAFNAAKAVLAKLALVLLCFLLLIQMISMFAGGGGGLAGSIILSPYEGPDDKLDLGPYNKILDEEWDEYMDELQQLGVEGGYYKVVIDMDVNPDNVKEILSMMAVRLDQDLDLLGNLQVKPYIEDLLRASHPYWTEKDTVTCDDIGTCSNKVYCSEDGKSCYSSSKLCSHGSATRHRDYYWSTEKDPKTGKEKDVKVWYTYYTWDCAGHCGGHPRITFHVRTLGFDEIFEVDPHGYPISSSASASTGALRGHYTITYYCNEKYPHTCNAGPPYKTATGTEPTPGRTIAVDPSDIALGAHVVIDGHEYVAEDTGGAVDGKHIDILVDTHEEALQLGTRYNVPVYKIKYSGESMEDSGEWSGWTDDNREWVKAIYEQDWTELYCGIPNVTDEVGRETDLSGVKFVNGSRPGHQSIVNIARNQEGQVGGRPFWSWYGFDSRVEWCACFVSWCANKDGVLDTKIPKFALCSDGAEWFVQHGQWAKRGDTTPVAGDIIFFSWNSNSRINHVGIVIGSDANYVYTIEGNSRDKCRVKSYPLNSSVIYGYGLPNY